MEMKWVTEIILGTYEGLLYVVKLVFTHKTAKLHYYEL